MLKHLDLNGAWKARGFDGTHGQPHQYIGANCDERTFIDAQVPGDIHLDLQREGLIEDTNYGLNAQAARWVEEQIWVYRREFIAPKDAVEAHAWLVFEGLDLDAVVYLNGEEVGRHSNVFRPLRVDVTGRLADGTNLLAVQVDGGLYSVSEKPGDAYQPAMDHRLHKRSWLRKPQCSFSWDWSPRLINVGIPKPVRLEWAASARIDAVVLTPELADDHKSAVLRADVLVECVEEQPLNAVVRLRLPAKGLENELGVVLEPGMSRRHVSIEIGDPVLWWPAGHGEQHLYNVELTLEAGGKTLDRATRRTGIRSIRIAQDPHPEKGRYFILEVNGQPVFAKGANWVPPDTIFSRITPEHYRKLVKLAADANFNALRIWGGGLYADHAMLDACDELGLLVWHDFVFACSKYPGDDPEFLQNVREEVAHVSRELSAHPSLVVWCGNNELEWGAWEWGYDQIKAFPDYALYHLEIPRILKREDPSRPYWPSSPFSPGHAFPNDPHSGDQHPWNVSLREEGSNFWAYREDVSRFPNEGGVLGATSPATLRDFLPEGHRRLFSPSWEFHDNSCNYWTERPIAYRCFEDWMGRSIDQTDFEDYAFYSALIQSEGLQEYINNFRRRMFSSSSAIFWMYNDCWPASHSWALVDYFLRRKLAYHPVRRAFAPISIVPAITGDTVTIFGVNDTLEAWTGEAQFGVFTLDGAYPANTTAPAVLAPNAATVLGSVSAADWERAGFAESGAFAVLTRNGETVAQQRLFRAPFKDLRWKPAEIEVRRDGDRAVFNSNAFAWAVCLDVDGEQPLDDDAFDLLPGIEYSVAWPSDRPLPQPQRIGSRLPWG